MFAPRPTKNDRVLVLLACLTGSSLASFARTTRTVYLPLTAGHEPSATGDVVAPGAIAPVYDPVNVRTVPPAASSSVSVIPWAPPAEATLPSFRSDTENATALPAAGLPGVHETDAA